LVGQAKADTDATARINVAMIFFIDFPCIKIV